MVQSKAKTVDQYLAELSVERRDEISKVRKVILKNLPKGYKEVMEYGMISYVIPLEKYPDTYNGHPLAMASLGTQKNYMALYLMGIYGDKRMNKWFVEEYKASGKKLDMGKSCVRFKKLEDVPLKVVGDAIKRVPVQKFIKYYEASIPAAR